MRPLSQSHLTLLSACPRKYQYIFFDGLSGPSTYEQQATTHWGSQFHLLMQQRALDLPVEVLSTADAEMAASLAALAKAAPDVFKHLPTVHIAQPHQSSDPNSFSQSEHKRTLIFNDYLLTVVYDLVVCSPEAGQIFDWKTHQRPPRPEWLQNDWQTRLYLYVLCETTALSPKQLSMVYWFVRLTPPTDAAPDAAPSFYRFGYSESQHDQTRRDLQALTDELTKMRAQGYFPKVAVEKGLCDRCPFNVRCDRIPPNSAIPTDPYHLLKAASQLTADSVEEIPL
ncbi:MAG: PD-(D/E)XK nuclease family protein [Phormidesmis sp.]